MIPISTHDMTKTTNEKRAKEPLSPVQAALAQRLRLLREARFPTVTQGDIAKLVGRTRSAVCLWESGETEPSCANLVKLSEFYGVSVNSLLGLEDVPSKPRPQTAVEIHTVPVLSEADMITWTVGRSDQVLMTRRPYDKGTAAAIRVESAALASACPIGSYAVVVAQRSQVNMGEVVVVAVDGQQAPLLRKVVRDGSNMMLIADDARYPTVQLNDRTRIIGRVVETVEFRAI